MGQIGIVGVAARCTPNFPADRTGSTAKAFSNVTDTAPVVEHGHYNGSFLSGQVGINSWHGSTLQEKVLHLVLEAAQYDSGTRFVPIGSKRDLSARVVFLPHSSL